MKNKEAKLIQHTPKIWTIDNFLSKAECESLIKMSECKGYEEAKVNSGGKQVMAKFIRNNSRMFHDDVSMAENYWQRLKTHCPSTVESSRSIGLNERFRFYRYYPDERFRPHVDGPFRRNDKEFSLITFLVYLNDNYSGGETKFKKVTVKPKIGTLLCFFHDLMHEGCTIKSGIKYALRTDVMYRLDE